MDNKIQKKIRSNQNVILHGWVEDLSTIFRKCSIYLHPGQGEPFGMGVVEAMISGLIPVVSDETGMKEFVNDVVPGNVLTTDPEQIASRITSIFSMSHSERKEISENSRHVSKIFDPGVSGSFKQDFNAVLSELKM